MSRRFGTENIFTFYDAAVSAGTETLLAPTPGVIYSPRQIVLAASGLTATAILSCGSVFLNAQVPAGDTTSIELPEGLNCPIGSGIDITVVGGDVAVSLYYVPYDKNPGITKVASRAASNTLQNQLDASGQKAIRTPNELNLGDKS